MLVSKRNWVRSAAMLALAAAAAGCSNDVARLNDGFYVGAMPQSATQQVAQAPAPQAIDNTRVGSIESQYPAQNAGTTFGTSSQIQRSQLPPPPGSAYQPASQPSMAANGLPQASPSSAQQSSATVPSTRPASSQPTQTASQPAPASPQPTQAASAAPSNGRTVTVQSGDSLNAIARRTGVRVADLRAANGLATDNIRIGQTLNLPEGGNTRVAALGAPESTLQAQAASQQPSAAPASPAPAQAEPAQAAQSPVSQPAQTAAAPAPAAPTTVAAETQSQVAALAPASTGISEFRWPVQGRVVKGFGDRIGSRRNDGVNISVPRGTPVKAAENGVVIYAGEGLKEFGKTVLVKHDNGLVTVYGHADEILVERGATVKRGQDIAKAGMTGETDVPVLHFEVRKDSTPVDPMTYL